LATGGHGREDILRSPSGHQTGPPKQHRFSKHRVERLGREDPNSLMILPQVHLRNSYIRLKLGRIMLAQVQSTSPGTVSRPFTSTLFSSIIAYDREHNLTPHLNLTMR
jgi:hypothetical protein